MPKPVLSGNVSIVRIPNTWLKVKLIVEQVAIFVLFIGTFGHFVSVLQAIGRHNIEQTSSGQICASTFDAGNKKRTAHRAVLQLVEKASQSFAPYGRERDCNHFRRRRVRRRKYFSRSERRIVRPWRTTEAQSAVPVSIGRLRPGDFVVKKGRREPFLTVSKAPGTLCPALSL